MADARRTSITGVEPGAKQSKTATTRKEKALRSSLGYILSTVVRLEDCVDSTPWVCKPYFQFKKAATPHVLRHYNNYAGPYVEIIRPYYDTIDRAVLSPSWTYAVKYGGPQMHKAQAFGQAQWATNIQPQLVKVQDSASKQYHRVLGPHVEKAAMVVAPYYEIGRSSATQTHHDVILPAYDFLSPYVIQVYSVTADFTTGTVVPAVFWTYSRATNLVYLTIMPQMSNIYVNIIEPQLEKIGIHPGRFGDKNQPDFTLRTGSSSFVKPAQASTSMTSVAPAKSSSSTVGTFSSEERKTATVTATAGSPEASQAKQQEPDMQDRAELKEEEAWRNARETVAEDLRAWQEKYTKAADEGAAEIDKSVEDISKRMIGRNARTTGRMLINDLQNSVAASLVELRQDVVATVIAVVEERTKAEDASKQVVAAVRRAGVNIKEKAQAVRLWREEYNKELHDTVNRAAENHFQILGSIRDLALQRIGMKWAWMEGVTYKDWAKYHQLKGRFEELESDLEQLIVTHPGIEAATSAAQAVEDEAMSLAQSAVKELARLKQVAELKIAELDTSDEFDADTIKANIAAAKAAAEEAAAAEALTAKLAEEAAAAELEAQLIREAERAAEQSTEEAVEADAQRIENAEDGTTEAIINDDATATEVDSVSTMLEGTETIAPDEVPIILGESAGSISEDTPTMVDDETAERTNAPVHLPVDEVVVAEEVPLAVASSINAKATIAEVAKRAEEESESSVSDNPI
ncbi:hypothetical protein SEPCBS119000_005406 [Sporothrix epigloea]|uniref:Transcription factor hoxa13 n=1 Tax=Sporothrix epigloea TaxID=1892477 RepID=A0ABP0DXG5_9PEZI